MEIPKNEIPKMENILKYPISFVTSLNKMESKEISKKEKRGD